MEQNFVMTTPVLMIMFNRPHKAAEVFAKVRQIRPPKLFIVVDGARPDRPGEEEKVHQCRAFKDMVDWDCDVKVDFAETNMGCKNRIASGITWAFEHVDELIILEDDCVPDLTFFRFCQELLEKYRDDNRVFTISGCSADYLEHFEESYLFGDGFGCWGWATWKRAWKHFDITMKQWPILKQDKYWNNIFPKDSYVLWKYDLMREFQLTYEGKIDTWDHIFTVNCLANHALHIMPRVNLVRNTGFESDGSHTTFPAANHLYMDEPIEFPLIHPEIMSPLNRLYGPPIIPETPENQNEIIRILTEHDNFLKRLLKLEQYHAVLIYFKENILRNRIFRVDHPLTPQHLNFAYYVALSYFHLKDYEHAAAMLDILLTFDPQNIDLLLFQTRTFICQGAFDKAVAVVEKMCTLEGDDRQRAEISELVEALNVR